MPQGQRIRYVRSADGVQIAWAEAGSGPPLVKAANWLTHLEEEWRNPVWRHWMEFLASRFRFVRYDERGCGMTDWNTGTLSLDGWVGQGAAICVAYAVRHPERVSRLILYGGYARGWQHRGDPEGTREYNAIIELVRTSWGKENPAFRRIFTSRFVPGGSDEQLDWWNELCRKTTTPANAADLMTARSHLLATDLLPLVQAPTLVIHARDDQVCPVGEGRFLAAGIPGAQFVELDSRNHILLENEPAWERFKEVVLEFAGLEGGPADEDRAFSSLSPRERDILAAIAEGLSNAEIGERLAISGKTVRNHVSNVFDKLGVWTRAQAIVFARDRGFKE
jgi:pimeloyl-ACP methyl ester carboxylesterase/DNA-binding CsgD family transcriptional regulator